MTKLPARGADNNVGAVVLQNLLVLGDSKTSEEHTNLEKLSYKLVCNLMQGVQHSFK